MSTILAIPLQLGTPQTISLTLSGTVYEFTFQYRNDLAGLGGWVLDIADQNGNPLVQGIPLVTGVNLLEQYAYLGFVAGLYVQTTDNPDTVPTFANLGGDGQVYAVTP